MGLELGPPWLAVAYLDGDGCEVIFRDNFTGAGFDRVRRAMKGEPGSICAVLLRSGELMRARDGAVFDLMAYTEGRNFGTSSDRAHRAYLFAIKADREIRGETVIGAIANISPWVWVLLCVVLVYGVEIVVG